MATYYHSPLLPWAASEEEEQRFRRILKRSLIVFVVFALIMPWLPTPKIDRAIVEQVPPRLAKLLIEREMTPPPPVARKIEPEPEVPSTKPLPKTETAKKPVPEARKPEPNKAPGEKVAAARRKAAGVGLLAMKEELAELRGAPIAAQLQKDIKPGPGVGSGKGPGVGAGRSPGVPTRSLITSAARGSGGINTASLSRDTGGGGLAGRATTVVEGVVGGGGGGGEEGAGGMLRRGGGGRASRSIEEIKIVFDRNKGSIYAIYNRALRVDPTLQGKVVLKLTIAPSGQVLDCRIVSSELRAPELERKLVARIKLWDFGAKKVDTIVVNWPVDFLPS
jgi:TonB family protein